MNTSSIKKMRKMEALNKYRDKILKLKQRMIDRLSESKDIDEINEIFEVILSNVGNSKFTATTLDRLLNDAIEILVRAKNNNTLKPRTYMNSNESSVEMTLNPFYPRLIK